MREYPKYIIQISLYNQSGHYDYQFYGWEIQGLERLLD